MTRAATGERMSMGELATRVVGPGDWPVLEEFFGPRGLVENCWCAYFRMAPKDYSACRPAERRNTLAGLVEAGERVGVLGAVDEVPVGWVGVGPRLGFPRLHRARVAKPLAGDDLERIWSVVCVYLRPAHRGRGLVKVLLDRAVRWAREEGAELIEAYPEDDRAAGFDRQSFHGRVSTFQACGFTVVEPRLQRRALMRRELR